MGRKKRGTKGNSESALIARADELFSILVRLKGLMHNNRVECYTCGGHVHFKSIQCGHYIGRGNMITRWLEENARPQCKYCNETLHGNMKVYTENLELDHPGLTEQLKQLGGASVHYTKSDLLDIIENLRKRIEVFGGMKAIPCSTC